MNIVEKICNTCSCNIEEAQEHLDNELRHLRELVELDDLRSDDISTSCSNLGLESDYEIYFINQLTIA